MTHEGGEHRRRGGEDHDTDESPETNKISISAQEMMRELRTHIEGDNETPESDEPPASAQETMKEARTEIEQRKHEQPTSDEDTDENKEILGEAEQCVKEATQELTQKEIESREQESEKQENLERAQEEREESGKKDSYDDLEREFLKNLEEKGVDAEDTKEHWREQFIKDIEEYLQESKNEQDTDNEQDEGERSSHSSTAECSSHYDDGSGQMYEVRSKPDAESATEAELGPKSEQSEAAPETIDSPESEPKGESKQADLELPEKETEDSPETQERSKARESSDEEVQGRISPQDEEVRDFPEENDSPDQHEKPSETVCNETEVRETEKVRPERTSDGTPTDMETSVTSDLPESTELTRESPSEQPAVDEKEIEAEVSQTEESGEEADGREKESLEDKFWRKRLLELYEEMPEEWKEAFREYLRSLIGDEEEFERLAEKHGLEYLLEDEEVMEEVRKFLKFKMALTNQEEGNIKKIAEELGIDSESAERWASGVEPQVLKDVLNREAFWTFWELVRYNAESSCPESTEELEEILASNPMIELADPMVPFEQWKRDAKAWIEIVGMKKRGEIGTRLRNSREIYRREDIEHTSEKHNISEIEIVSWLRGEKAPPLIERISSMKLKKWNQGKSQSEKQIDSRTRNLENEPRENSIHDVIHRLYFEEGLTQREIAKKLGISRSRIMTTFETQGWKFRPAKQRRQEANPEEVHRLYFDVGLSQRKAADELGLRGPSPIQRIFKEMGWKTRGKWGHGALYGRKIFDTQEERELAKKERSEKRQQDLKELREKLFGTKCKICGTSNQNKSLVIHRKDFKEHKQNTLWIKGNLQSLNTDNWTALCVHCHRMVHWLNSHFKLEWYDIDKYLERKNSETQQAKEPFTLSGKETISNRYKEIAESANGNVKELRRLLFGDECYFCNVDNEERKLVIHRRDGRPHNRDILWRENGLGYLNPEDWVLLCRKCHRYVHWAEDNLGLAWEDLRSL